MIITFLNVLSPIFSSCAVIIYLLLTSSYFKASDEIISLSEIKLYLSVFNYETFIINFVIFSNILNSCYVGIKNGQPFHAEYNGECNVFIWRLVSIYRKGICCLHWTSLHGYSSVVFQSRPYALHSQPSWSPQNPTWYAYKERILFVCMLILFVL